MVLPFRNDRYYAGSSLTPAFINATRKNNAIRADKVVPKKCRRMLAPWGHAKSMSIA